MLKSFGIPPNENAIDLCSLIRLARVEFCRGDYPEWHSLIGILKFFLKLNIHMAIYGLKKLEIKAMQERCFF